jgi:hypothetical protein
MSKKKNIGTPLRDLSEREVDMLYDEERGHGPWYGHGPGGKLVKWTPKELEELEELKSRGDSEGVKRLKESVRKRMLAVKVSRKKIDMAKIPRWKKTPVHEEEFIEISGMKKKLNTKIPGMIRVKEKEYKEKSGLEEIEEMTKRAKKIGGTGKLNF